MDRPEESSTGRSFLRFVILVALLYRTRQDPASLPGIGEPNGVHPEGRNRRSAVSNSAERADALRVEETPRPPNHYRRRMDCFEATDGGLEDVLPGRRSRGGCAVPTGWRARIVVGSIDPTVAA